MSRARLGGVEFGLSGNSHEAGLDYSGPSDIARRKAVSRSPAVALPSPRPALRRGRTIRFARAIPGTLAASVSAYSQKTRPKIGCNTEKPVQILPISFQQSYFLRRQSIRIRIRFSDTFFRFCHYGFFGSLSR